MQYSPTILIGLGGLGSTIVNNIYAKLHPDMLRQTVILAMDTDVNWIRSLKDLPDNNIIQTSLNQTVGQYLYNKERSGDQSVKEWFPTDILEMTRKLMTDGAGQVRGVSRLALTGAIENNEVQKIVAEISRINTQSTSKFISGVRVCLVGSLAGGTGSGMFLQVALMLRKLLRERFGVETVMSIGYFLLGGVLEGCGKITGLEEVDNINANTYACFKELNALTENASSTKSNSLNIKFEFDPYNPNPMLSNRDLPFDYYHLIDHLNLNGKNLGAFENYLTMMTNNIYVYLFSPIASGAFSKLDNQILSVVKSRGQSRVCGSAAGRLVYPYQDVLRLFAIRRTVNGISSVWTKFDDLFEEDMNEYKRQRNQGNTKADKPVLRKKYIFYLENTVQKQKADPNFVLINNQLNLFDENKEIIGRKSVEFIQSIEDEILRRFENDEKLLAIQEDRSKMPKLDKLQVAETARGQIDNAERLLTELERGARDFVANNKILARNILFDDEQKNLQEQKIYTGEKYYLNYWILNDEPMHPIAARIFIYEVWNDLETRVLELKHELEELKDDYEGIKNKYNDRKSKGMKRTAQDELYKILNQPFYKKVMSGKKDLKLFAEGFSTYFRKRKTAIVDLSAKELQLSIFEALQNWLKLQAAIMEEFFFSLDRILDRFDLENKELSIKYEYEGGYDRNILAKPSVIETLWKDKENQLVSFDELPDDLSKTIYSTFYDKFCEKAGNEHLKIGYSDDFLKQISERILKNNSRYIENTKVLDLDIIAAIREEGRLLGKSKQEIDKYLSEKLIELKNLVRAFGPDSNRVNLKSSFYSMWGINEGVNKFIPQKLKDELEMEDTTAASFIIDERFDKREIIRSKILMGQSLDQFLKFYHGDETKSEGAYYRSYSKRIKDLQNPNTQMITPHLDKRWHLPNYLPEIFPDLNEKVRMAAIDTLLKGVITQTIAIRSIGGLLTWTAHHQALVDSEGRQISSLNIDRLLDAIFQNPHLEEKIAQKYAGQLQQDRLCHKKDYEKFQLLYQVEQVYYPILRQEPCQLLDVLLHYFQSETYQHKDRTNGMLLLKRFRQLLEGIIETAHPTDAPFIQSQKYRTLIKERLLPLSMLYLQLPANDAITGEIKDILLS